MIFISNRKFILCQIDEPIQNKKPGYHFCMDNGLPPVISSITIERINRAGNKIKEQSRLVNNDLDIGYKVFELTDAPDTTLRDDGQIDVIDNITLTPFDRIINLIFKVGVDNPAIVPQEIVKDCLYRIGSNYYITDSIKLDNAKNRMLLKDALQPGNNVYVDGWTATLNTTLSEHHLS